MNLIRGGAGIGGPLWTDFSVLEQAAANNALPTNIVQGKLRFIVAYYYYILKLSCAVVGHTVSKCYMSYTGHLEHPPDDFAPCLNGLIRSTANQEAICVDSGMIFGARGFLEIDASSANLVYKAHEKSGNTGVWKVTTFS